MRKARESSMLLGRMSIVRVLTLAVASSFAPLAASAADVTVILDQAKLVKLPEKVSTIVIGNPLIADA